MNRGELIESVKTYLGENFVNGGPGYYTPAEYIRFVNIANQVVNSILINIDADYFLRPFGFQTVAGTSAYSLPPDCSRLHDVFITDLSGCRLQLRPLRPMLQGQTNQFPCGYVLRQNQIDLHPTPDAAYTVEFFFDQVKTDLTQDIEVPSSPVEYHDMIALYAAITASAKDGRNVGILADLYKARKEDMILTYGQRNQSDRGSIFGDF